MWKRRHLFRPSNRFVYSFRQRPGVKFFWSFQMFQNDSPFDESYLICSKKVKTCLKSMPGKNFYAAKPWFDVDFDINSTWETCIIPQCCKIILHSIKHIASVQEKWKLVPNKTQVMTFGWQTSVFGHFWAVLLNKSFRLWSISINFPLFRDKLNMLDWIQDDVWTCG